MSQTTIEMEPATESYDDDGEFNYRSMSRAAVLCTTFALFGLLAWFSPLLLFLPMMSLVFGVVAFKNLARFPSELVGKPLAWIGSVLSGVVLVVAPIYHTYVYYTEVPEGFERISFSTLMASKKEEDRPPMEALALDGKKVFLKGYIHPTSISSAAAKTFVIVPDLGTCCFGGQPPLTHMIEVRLVNDHVASKGLRRHSLAGTLEVHPNPKPVDGLIGVFYQLEAEHFN